jgi:NADP-dependent 3-hydroxy acid dehydrogenase YdfG
MNNRLLNKVVLLTGGGSWIGKEIARVFCREGAKVFIIGRDEKKLSQTVSEIGKSRFIISSTVADISNKSSIQSAVDTAVSAYGKIDIQSFPIAK